MIYDAAFHFLHGAGSRRDIEGHPRLVGFRH
jgi:hypothetical protein